MPPSSLHQQALQRLSLLRVASIGTWIAFVFYFVFQHAIILSYTSLMIATYVGLVSVGAWQAWRSQVYSKHLTIHLVLECQLLTCMLFYSGGAANPLISYFFILLVIAAYSLPLKHAIAITALSIRSEEHTSELQSRP